MEGLRFYIKAMTGYGYCHCNRPAWQEPESIESIR